MGFGFRGSGDQTRQMIRELAQARPVTDAQRQYLAGPGPDGTAPTGYGSFDVTAELTRGWRTGEASAWEGFNLGAALTAGWRIGGAWEFHGVPLLSRGMLSGPAHWGFHAIPMLSGGMLDGS